RPSSPTPSSARWAGRSASRRSRAAMRLPAEPVRRSSGRGFARTRAPRTTLLALAALVCLFCGGVRADPAPSGTATAQPNTPSQPSHIVIDAKGSSGGLGSSLPQGVTAAVYKGFVLDLQAVAERCSDAQ